MFIDGGNNTPKASKVSGGRGGARPGAGRKKGIKIISDVYEEYNKARAKKTLHEANLAEYEEMEKSGELIGAAKVRDEWQRILGNVRARLLALPVKLAAQAYGAGSIAEMEALLAEGVHEALQELAADA